MAGALAMKEEVGKSSPSKKIVPLQHMFFAMDCRFCSSPEVSLDEGLPLKPWYTPPLELLESWGGAYFNGGRISGSKGSKMFFACGALREEERKKKDRKKEAKTITTTGINNSRNYSACGKNFGNRYHYRS